MNAQQKILDTVEDLQARLKAEEKAFEQAENNKQRLTQERDALTAQPKSEDSTQKIQKQLAELNKRYAFQCEQADRSRLQIEQLKEKQLKISENFSTLIGMSQESPLADALFSIAQHVDEQRQAEHAAVRAAASIHGLAGSVSQMPLKSKEKFSRYVQLHGVAQTDTAVAMPFCGKKAACYETIVNLIHEDGTETLVWNESRLDALCIADARHGDALHINAESYGTKLCMDTVTDTTTRAEDLPTSIKERIELPSQILNYHVVEKAIAPGSPLFAEGEVYWSGDTLHIRRVFDRAHTPIVTTKTEREIKKPRTQNTKVSIIVGAVFLIFAVIILITNLTK